VTDKLAPVPYTQDITPDKKISATWQRWLNELKDRVDAFTAGSGLPVVNANVGTFGSATRIPRFTVTAQGLITAASDTAVVPGPTFPTSAQVLARVMLRN
jgi:hypothetical protein